MFRCICLDLFPRTSGTADIKMDVSSHVETVCLLSKLNVKQHIEVELTMDEMDLTAAEKKASYEEIKEYVQEKELDTLAVIHHYDALIDEGNDPIHDPQPLQEYMDKWDGAAFIEQMQLNNKKAVLEIGVGTGRLAVRTAPLCSIFYGIDISPKTVKRAKKNLFSYENVTLICADLHIEQKRNAVKKAAELLNDGGIFVLSIDKNPAEFIDFGTRKLKIYPDKPEEIESYIKVAGMTTLNRYNTEFATIFVAQKDR